MTDTQEMDTASLVCVECGAERPEQDHDPLCPRLEGDVEPVTDDASPSTESVPTEPVADAQPQEISGGWIVQIVPEHVCIKPSIDNRTFVGSVWRCGECTQNWLVYERRGKRAGEKAFKRITTTQADERVTKHREKLAKAAAAS